MLKKIEHTIRRFFPKRMRNHRFYLDKFRGLSGLEIGGPSPTFNNGGFLPLYKVIPNLDGCNFSDNTVWEGQLVEGNNYRFGDRTGYQIISDGTNLEQVSDGNYDFVLSCHSLEHFANPIKALVEWKRIIKEDGYLVIIVPHKDGTFDHNRPTTTLEHLLKDYENNVGENDDTHFEEVISLHDLTKDDGVKDVESLKMRTADNFKNRCVHQHVFNTPLVVRLADQLNLKICDIQHFNPFNIIVLLQKKDADRPDNTSYFDPSNLIYHNVKFPSDKNW